MIKTKQDRQRRVKKTRSFEPGSPDWHQFQIAKRTLAMSDMGANVMGGMTKDEARAFLTKHGIKNKYEK